MGVAAIMSALVLKQDWKGKGKSKNVADALNSLAFQLNNANVPSGGTAQPTPTGFQIEVDGDRPVAFKCTLSGAIATVAIGTIRKHGIGKWGISEDTDVALTGTEEWVYVSMPRAGGTVTIQHSSTEPESNSSTLKVPLCYYELSGTTYALVRICHEGDINFDTPIR